MRATSWSVTSEATASVSGWSGTRWSRPGHSGSTPCSSTPCSPPTRHGGCTSGWASRSSARSPTPSTGRPSSSTGGACRSRWLLAALQVDPNGPRHFGGGEKLVDGDGPRPEFEGVPGEFGVPAGSGEHQLLDRVVAPARGVVGDEEEVATKPRAEHLPVIADCIVQLGVAPEGRLRRLHEPLSALQGPTAPDPPEWVCRDRCVPDEGQAGRRLRPPEVGMIHEPDDLGGLVGPIKPREVGHRLEERVE